MFSVIIPCFNEEANLKLLFVKVEKLLEEHPKAEVVLVNNGSKDNSLALMNLFKMENKHLNISICNIKENEGYGHGILEGLKIAKNEILAWTHADLQTDIMDCSLAFKKFSISKNQENLLIKGYRKNRKLGETILSFGMAIFASLKLNTWLVEINAQPKMFHKNFYNNIKDNAPKDFSLDLYWVYQYKQKGNIKTIPVSFLPRLAGEAKGGSGSNFKTKIKIIKRTLNYINSLKSKFE